MQPDPNEFLRQAVVRICGNLEIEKAMSNCLDYLAEYIPLDSLQLSTNHPELKMVQVVHSVSELEVPEVGTLLPFPKKDFHIREQKWPELESILLINEPASDPTLKLFSEQSGIPINISLMILHLEIEGEEIGKLTLKAEGINRFSIAHAKLLLLLKEPFAIALLNSLRHQEVKKLKDMLSDDYRHLQRDLQQMSCAQIVGADFGLKDVMEKVRQVAAKDSPVLLLGETGVGKEVIANAIHYSSLRRQEPFIRVNCGAIPSSLIDSELFGHEKGAFTGAAGQKRGRFERADNGTIFLDEVGELPPQAQARLLHVLQNHEIERVGGTEVVPVNIRVILATHRNLEKMVSEGLFRKDLYFRMNVFPIVIPPLRNRKEDLPALVHHFIEKKVVQLRVRERPRLAPGSVEKLKSYNWPGNIRELENLIERSLIQYHGKYLNFTSLLTIPTTNEDIETTESKDDGMFLSLEQLTIQHIKRALLLCHGKISGPGGAAELLNIHPNTLRKKMDKLQISYRKNLSYT